MNVVAIYRAMQITAMATANTMVGRTPRRQRTGNRVTGMKKFLFALAFLFIPSVAWAQCTGVFPANTICGNNTGTAAVPSAQPSSVFSGVSGPTSSFTGDQALWGNFSGSALIGSSSGVFNVRQKFGAKPDGATDNSAAITSAFTASNRYTATGAVPAVPGTGVPTVYFDCNSNVTTCIYNFSGATSSGSVSSINPTVPTTILCAPGATLNYTGTGHAIDLGPVGGVAAANAQFDFYTIMGCRFTGGTSMSAGIYIYDYIVSQKIAFNSFMNFGNSTAYDIVYTKNNSNAQVFSNIWQDSSGNSFNIIDGHTAVNGFLEFSHNTVGCVDATCNQANQGVGLWVWQAHIHDNDLASHNPLIRISSCQVCGGGDGVWIYSNHLENGPTMTSPAISFGDPGAAGSTIPPLIMRDNFLFWQLTAGNSFVMTNTSSGGSFNLSTSIFDHNYFGNNPGAGAPFINTNGGLGNIIGINFASSAIITRATANPIIDTGFAQQKAIYPVSTGQPGNGSVLSSISSALAAYDANGVFLTPAGPSNVGTALICANTTASNTQACQTASGIFSVPGVGDVILYNSTFTNTGPVTLNLNGNGAAPVKKNGGFSTLVAGDLQANVTYPMTFDGTNWQMTPNSKLTENMSLTFATLPTPVAGMQAYITDAAAGNCGDSSCTTFGTSLSAGGGALPRLIWYNGTNWTLVGK